MLKSFLVLFVLWILTGCVSTGYAPKIADKPTLFADTEQCSKMWNDFQLSVNMQGTFDAQDWPLPEYGFLRLDRAASHFLGGHLTDQQKLSWLELTYNKGKLARELENNKLTKPFDMTQLETCLSQLLPELVSDSQFWSHANTQSFPDRYSVSRQIFGLYYVFRPVVNWQVKALNERVANTFQRYETERPWHLYSLGEQQSNSVLTPSAQDGQVRPSSLMKSSQHDLTSQDAVNPESTSASHDVRTILNPGQQKNALGLPVFSKEQIRALAEYYHPVIALEFGHEDDRIGRPVNVFDEWTVSTRPQLFTSLATVWWKGQWLPQIVYHWWYPARPKVGFVDILAGELDGLIWRVTLDWEGNVLFYDSIHPCGCYHKVYPTNPRIVFQGTREGEEKLMVLPVSHPGHGFQPLIKITSIAHYVVGLEFTQVNDNSNKQDPDDRLNYPESFSYGLSDYNDLRRQKSGDQFLFDSDGLVSGTERLERFLLWNMGVISPGAMRQWGHHATAFVSRRHFDDPMFFETYFELSDVGTANSE